MSGSSCELANGGLLKEQLAAEIKQAIVEGRLVPGQRVVEGTWAKQFGVAQASIREAINLLISEGFLVKDAGRSARVVNYSERDIIEIYEVRSALEGVAAQLAAAVAADVSVLETAMERMSAAAKRRDMRTLVESDLEFHLALAVASGNALLADFAKRLLSPLFAFILMRVLRSGQGPEAWLTDLPKHQMIVEFIREGNPALAGQYVQHCMRSFANGAYAVWGNANHSLHGRWTGEAVPRTKHGA